MAKMINDRLSLRDKINKFKLQNLPFVKSAVKVFIFLLIVIVVYVNWKWGFVASISSGDVVVILSKK